MTRAKAEGSFQNIRLTLEFDGTEFNGWQTQESGRTVQREMERAIQKLTGESLRVTGCSRTDAGVHARNFIMNFYTATNIPPERLRFPLNAILPQDIRVKDSRAVPWAFHSRKDARAKTYVYRFVNGDTEPAIGRQYLTLVKGRLAEASMQETAALFCGTHDFRAFMSLGSSAKTTVRTVYESSLSRTGCHFEFRVTGDGFLYNMVRIMAGTLMEVGLGSRSTKEVAEALRCGDRLMAGKVAQAKGLILEAVYYEGDSWPHSEEIRAGQQYQHSEE